MPGDLELMPVRVLPAARGAGPASLAGGLLGRVRARLRPVVIVATVDAADVAEALDLAWWTFQKVTGNNNPAGWALAGAEAEVRPEAR